jgi:hypothetical protein
MRTWFGYFMRWVGDIYPRRTVTPGTTSRSASADFPILTANGVSALLAQATRMPGYSPARYRRRFAFCTARFETGFSLDRRKG